MISDKLFNFSKKTAEYSFLGFKYGLIALFLAVPGLLAGWLVALLFSGFSSIFDAASRPSTASEIFFNMIFFTIGPVIAAPVLLVGGSVLLLLVFPISFLSGSVTRFFEIIMCFRRSHAAAEAQRIEEQANEQERVMAQNIQQHQQQVQNWAEQLAAIQAQNQQQEAWLQAAAQPPHNWDQVDEALQIRAQLVEARDNYNNAPLHRKQACLARLRTLYDNYLAVFPLHPLGDIEQTLNNAYPRESKAASQEQNNHADPDYSEHKKAFLEVFQLPEVKMEFKGFSLIGMREHAIPIRNPFLKKATHVLECPLTSDEINCMQMRLRITAQDDAKTREEKNRNQRIFNAACDDQITFDSMRTPVRLPNGKTYDLLTVTRLDPKPQHGGKRVIPPATSPTSSDLFTLDDVIPNNTLGKAMKTVLGIAAGEPPQEVKYDDSFRQKVEETKKLGAEAKQPEAKQGRRKPQPNQCLTDEEASHFRTYRAGLKPEHQVLFDLMCRDPLTGTVFQDPVYLPDGYTYERMTVMTLLRQSSSAGEAICPFASHLVFREEDIRMCFSTRDMMDQIKTEITTLREIQQKEQKAQPAASTTSSIHQALNITPDGRASAEERIELGDDDYSQTQGRALQEIYGLQRTNGLERSPLLRVPLRIDEIKRINTRLLDGDANINALFSVACMDGKEMMRTPVRLAGETRDLSKLSDCKQDIIPNNTLMKSMQVLLNFIDGKPLPKMNIKKDRLLRFLTQTAPTQPKFSVADIGLIEGYYKSLSKDVHRLLFDMMCRDPITGKVFQNPVYLPDGCTYESTTVELLLSLSVTDRATIPGTNISFAKDDIKPCQLTIKVMEELKKIALAKQYAAQQRQSNRSGLR